MPVWLKRILWLLGILLILLLGIFIIFFNDPLPQGTSPEKADELAHKMLEALNDSAYKQTRYLDWSYQGGRNSYHWDKALGKVEMSWGEYSGTIDLVTPEHSIIKVKGNPVSEEDKSGLINMAISNFNNDSFWLVAPFKIFDQGTKRSLVELDNGRKGILVTYTTGGDTPGDTYLWELNDQFIPVKFSMWVQIVPLKGLGASWEGWRKTESGVLLPQFHKVGPITLDLGTVRAYR